MGVTPNLFSHATLCGLHLLLLLLQEHVLKERGDGHVRFFGHGGLHVEVGEGGAEDAAGREDHFKDQVVGFVGVVVAHPVDEGVVELEEADGVDDLLLATAL